MAIDDEMRGKVLGRSAPKSLVMLETGAGPRHPIPRFSGSRESDDVERSAVGKIADGPGVVDADARIGRERGIGPPPEGDLLPIDRRCAAGKVVDRPVEVRRERPGKGEAHHGADHPKLRPNRSEELTRAGAETGQSDEPCKREGPQVAQPIP